MRAVLLGSGLPLLDGRYRIDRVLGRGATGVVLRARDERLARDVAVKVAPASAASLQMLDEARALAQLQRPQCVVQVWETAGGQLSGSSWIGPLNYIVMELVVGVTLREWQVQGRSVAEILNVYANVAVGLYTVHTQGIAHGDVKPDNVIVDGSGLPTLVDFGFAARMQERRVGALRGEVVGTPPYMAPEARVGQARRKGDVHAYAVALWEALTGQLPFEGAHAPVGIFGIRRLPGEARVPRRLRRSLKRAMRLLPGLRPSIAELHRDVQRAATEQRSRRGPRRVVLHLVAATMVVAAVGLSYAWFSDVDSPSVNPLQLPRTNAADGAVESEATLDAVAAFRHTQQMWSTGTEQQYLDGYEPILACYYNAREVSRDRVQQARRAAHFALDDRPPPHSTEVASERVSETQVVLRERRRLEGGAAARPPRTVEMHLSDGVWRIRQEVSETERACWRWPQQAAP